MVDLDGARTGSAQNQEIILRIARETSLLVEAGGGIRDMDTVAYYLQNGVSRVVLGSAALENPQLVKKAVEQYGSRVAVGIDAKNGMVSARGWLSDSQTDYLSQLSQLRKRVSCRLTASGGIRSLEDLKVLDAANIEAAILGKALYTGAIDLTEAIHWAGVQREG